MLKFFCLLSEKGSTLRMFFSLTSFIASGFFYLNSLDLFISSKRGVWLVFTITMFYKKNHEFNANSADPDQTPRSVASDLGLHCLPVSHLWDARLKRVKNRPLFERNSVYMNVNRKSQILPPL